MLYDPRWEKTTGTGNDPFAIATFIAWLELQPSNAIYCYSNIGDCLLAQFFQAHGMPNVTVGGKQFSPKGDGNGGPRIPLPRSFAQIALGTPHTFGAALLRARDYAGC